MAHADCSHVLNRCRCMFHSNHCMWSCPPAYSPTAPDHAHVNRWKYKICSSYCNGMRHLCLRAFHHVNSIVCKATRRRACCPNSHLPQMMFTLTQAYRFSINGQTFVTSDCAACLLNSFLIKSRSSGHQTHKSTTACIVVGTTPHRSHTVYYCNQPERWP